MLKEVWSWWNFGSGAGVVYIDDFGTMAVCHPTLGRDAHGRTFHENLWTPINY